MPKKKKIDARQIIMDAVGPQKAPRPDTTGLDDDAKWLVELDEALREVTLHWDRLYERQMAAERFIDDRKLTVAELTRLLKIVKDEKRFTFTPTNCGSGFRVGFDVHRVEVLAPGIPAEVTFLVCVSERQLPDGWGWCRLKDHFTSNEQLELYRMDRVTLDRGHYTY